jgi:hypothetical protein
MDSLEIKLRNYIALIKLGDAAVSVIIRPSKLTNSLPAKRIVGNRPRTDAEFETQLNTWLRSKNRVVLLKFAI